MPDGVRKVDASDVGVSDGNSSDDDAPLTISPRSRSRSRARNQGQAQTAGSPVVQFSTYQRAHSRIPTSGISTPTTSRIKDPVWRAAMPVTDGQKRVSLDGSTAGARRSNGVDDLNTRYTQRIGDLHTTCSSGASDTAPLEPPRPRFFAETRIRQSWSSQDTSGSYVSVEDSMSTSDSDGEARRTPGKEASTVIPRNGPYSQAGAYPKQYTGMSATSTTSDMSEPGSPIGNGPPPAVPVNVYSHSRARSTGSPLSTLRDRTLPTTGVATRRHVAGGSAPPSSFNFPPNFTPHPYAGPASPDPLMPANASPTSPNGNAPISPRSSTESLRSSHSGLYNLTGPIGQMQIHAMQMQSQLQQMQERIEEMAKPAPPPATPNAAMLANSAVARDAALSTSTSATDLAPAAMKMNGVVPTRPASADGYPQGYQYSQGFVPGHERHKSLSRVPSTLREPFLSPASRRASGSQLWTPPTPVALYHRDSVAGSSMLGHGGRPGTPGPISGTGSSLALALPGKKEPLPSSALERKLGPSDKPWIKKKDKWERISWWVTFLLMWLGVAAGGILCFFGYQDVDRLGKTCPVLVDNFDNFNEDVWHREVELGGFGNGEFQMTTDSDENLFIRNGQLYIVPTLTSDEIGEEAIFNGYTYRLSGCTTRNTTACTARSNARTNSVINPVKSARITTQNSASIAFGKVEVRAKLPRGDWLWPAIWMLPVDNDYGPWPLSGEIDIMEARGNDASYPGQGRNFVRSSVNWGPLPTLVARIFGWQSQKQSTFADGFHTYTLEWDSKFMRFSVDSRLHAMLRVDINRHGKGKGFFHRGGFPPTAQNGSTEVVVQDPWTQYGVTAPFDRPFYLIIDLAVGGTSGWFPDKLGDKPWFDGSASAMTDFARQQNTWATTWPQNIDERAFRIDYVKMWSLC